MSHVKIDQEDVVTIICKLICQLSQSIWNENHSVRRSTRKTKPRDFYDPTSVDAHWLSPEGLEIQNGSNSSQNGSQNYDIESDEERDIQIDTNEHGNSETSEIQERLDELEIDVNMSIESPGSDSVIDESALLAYLSLPCKSHQDYQKRAQLVIVLRSILRAKKQKEMKRMRRILYESKQTFENDINKVSAWVQKLSKFWGVHPSAFNLLPCPKGQVAGPIHITLKTDLIVRESQDRHDDSQSARSFTRATFSNSQSTNDSNQTTEEEDITMSELASSQQESGSCMSNTLNAVQRNTNARTSTEHLFYTSGIIEDISIIEKVTFTHPVPWVLVIEKETMFNDCITKLNQALNNGRNNNGKGFGIIITGKGFPDFATRRFVDHLRELLPVDTPFHILTDGDAYGMNIAKVYLSNFKRQAHCSTRTRCSMEWIGLQPSRWREFVGRNQEIAMSYSQQQEGTEEGDEEEEEEGGDRMQDVLDSQRSFRDDAACILDVGGKDDCIELKTPEIERALSLLLQNDLGETFKYELSKLLMLGFKMELETVGNLDLHDFLPILKDGNELGCMQMEVDSQA